MQIDLSVRCYTFEKEKKHVDLPAVQKRRIYYS